MRKGQEETTQKFLHYFQITAMGKLAVIKTQETDASVDDFLSQVPDAQQKKDSQELIKLMKKATGEKPKLWGSAIIGFGNVRYKSAATGREVDWFRIGFSPRKANLSLYLTTQLNSKEAFLKKLGKHKTGGGCIYIKKLEDVDMKVLTDLINSSATPVKEMTVSAKGNKVKKAAKKLPVKKKKAIPKKK